MTHWKASALRIPMGALCALALGSGCSADGADRESTATTAEGMYVYWPPPPPITPPTDPAFFLQPLGRMCVDFIYGQIGTAANLYPCNGTLAQQVGVREFGNSHDVTLHLNGYCVGARGGVAEGAILELQTCDGSEGQEFAYDGDALIAGHRLQPLNQQLTLVGGGGAGGIAVSPPIARQYVIKPQGDVTGARTPMVLATRTLSENEYLRFVAADGSSRPPHSGFVSVTPVGNAAQSGCALGKAISGATWGTVVQVADSTQPYDLRGYLDPINCGAGTSLPVYLQSGATLRGQRKWTDNGPLLQYSVNEAQTVLAAAADDVRITGLRLEGPPASTSDPYVLTLIELTDTHRILVDHVEISGATNTGVGIGGAYSSGGNICPSLPAQPRPTPVRVARNFIHHNLASNEGYGAGAGDGAFPLIEGNVFDYNRHSIAADPVLATGYVATDNLVLSDAPTYKITDEHEQDFDVHGSGGGTNYVGGYAGDYVDILYNTFLGTNRNNFALRGLPCRPGVMDGNIFLQDQDDALLFLDYDGNTTSNPQNFTVTANNAFESANPTNDLGVGDFDGDGVDDVFLGTGNGWFYASGAKAEWRWLRRNTEPASALRFADLDGDGRTDVLAVHTPGTLDVSWGGVSGWQPLTTMPAAVPIGNVGVGRFDTSPGDDLFLTDGATWYLASGGQNFVAVGGSSHVAADLRFGDLDGNGITDVFTIDGGRWAYSSGARAPWNHLSGPCTGSMSGVVLGDFDGDGTADVGQQFVGVDGQVGVVAFDVSSHGTGAFTTLQLLTTPVVLTGRFDPSAPSASAAVPSLLLWWGFDGLHFVVADGPAPGQTWSRQEMR
ncbi:MAG TPA: FG-GAP-like repeat-containing protein [Polyangiaceae bacterium]